MTKHFTLLLLFFSFFVNAQDYTFKITDGQEPIPGATVVLENNGKTYADISDGDGVVVLKLQENMIYKIRVSSIGYEPLNSEIITNKKEFNVTLKESSTQLEAITVEGRRPLITQDGDKSIVDPEALIESSTNLEEVLEKTPGLFTDSDGNIYLSSTTPAKVYINGREQRMAAEDLATILRSLPPNSVKHIEIIRVPSANMEASNTGGAVNIVLKKGFSMLGSGSVSAGMNQGKYGNQFLNGSYNRTHGATSYFINGGINNRNWQSFRDAERSLSSENNLISNSETLSKDISGSINYGISHELSKKWDVAYDGRLILRDYDNNNHTVSTSFFNEEKIFENLNKINTTGNSIIINQNINSKIKFDSLETRKITFDLSGNFIRPKSNQFYTNQVTGDVLLGNVGTGLNTSQSDFYNLKVDFEYLFDNQLKLESGGQISLQNFSSTADFTTTIDEVTRPDERRNNRFEYNNMITGLYLQGTKNFGPYSLKTGLRLEGTHMNGHQIIPTDTTFKINRADLFPFIYFGRKLATLFNMDVQSYIIARRTIKRPGYGQLNPFRQYIDEFMIQSGNPALKPQFANNYEFNINVDGYPIFAFGQNFINDIFTEVIYPDKEAPHITVQTYDNLAKNKETYFRMIGAVPPGKRYFFVLGTQYSLNDYSGLYDNTPINFKRGTWRFFTFQQFKIDRRSTVSLNGFYMTKGQMNFIELSNFGNLNFSINRRFLDNKLTVTLNANDLLKTNRFNFMIDQPSMQASGKQYFDSRRFGINIRYNFGIRKKESGGFLDQLGPMEESRIE